MLINHNFFLRTSAIVVVCVMSWSVTNSVLAQDNNEGFPPQSKQLTLPENEVTITDTAKLPAVAPSPNESQPVAVAPTQPQTQPNAPLDTLVPEPAVEGASQMPMPVPYSGAYYDADSIGPSELGASAGPRKVDPKYEPGSSFVVVKKNASASSRQATIVAAQRALKLERYSAALELYENLYKKNPKDKQVLMGLAVAQQYNGFNESAMATYEELLKIDPRNSGAMVNMMGLMENSQPELAYRKLRDLWSKNGRNPAVAAQLGLVAAKMNNYEEATHYLGVAASLEPDNALNYYNLAIVMDRANSPKSAIEYYQKALEVDVASGGSKSIPREEVYDRLAQLRRM